MSVIRKTDGKVYIPMPLGGERMEVDVKVRVVESSNVLSVSWDDSTNMYVRFKGGGIYAYLGVSRQRAVAMAYAQSVGGYFHRKIKDHYGSVKLA